jgi:hypothetical protein
MSNATFKDTSVADVGLTILSAVSVALSGVGRPAERVLMYPGTVAWDGCDCGQLAMGVTTHFNSKDLVNDSGNSYSNCTAPARVARYSLSIIRCIPGPDDLGNPPSPGALTNAFQIQESDAFIAWHTVQCQLTLLENVQQPGGAIIGAGLMLDQIVLQTLGACTGTELHFSCAWWRDDCQCT